MYIGQQEVWATSSDTWDMCTHTSHPGSATRWLAGATKCVGYITRPLIDIRQPLAVAQLGAGGPYLARSKWQHSSLDAISPGQSPKDKPTKVFEGFAPSFRSRTRGKVLEK